MLFVLHDGLANAATIFTLVLALWGFLRYFQGRGVEGDYLGAVVIAELLILVEGIVGGVLFGMGARPVRSGIHILYGVCAIISFPALYAYTRGRDSRTEMLLWALLALFVFGLTLRARTTAG